jgi:hypothetical protein
MSHLSNVRRSAADAFGPWLDRLQYRDQDPTNELTQPWSCWCTWTFETELTHRGTRRAIEAHIDRTNASFAFWATEAGKVNGRLHGHGLMHFKSRQLRLMGGFDEVEADWERKHGFAVVKDYDPEKGATHYVSKYVSKRLADYDFGGTDPRLSLPGV